MDPELLAYLQSLGVRPDALAGIGGKRPTATQQVKGAAGAAFDALVTQPVKNVTQAIWEQKPGALGLELALGAVPFGKPAARPTKQIAKALAKELAERGGFSARPLTGELLGPGTKGYAVGKGSTAPILSKKKPSVREIEKFLIKHQKDLKGDDIVLGGWVDDKGVAHIEPSQLVTDRAKAVRLGMQREQQAVWDFERGAEISTKPVKVKHYSPQENLTTLKTEFAGTGPFKGVERKRRDRPPALHFYRENATPERELAGLTKYSARVPEGGLYDLKADPEGLVKKHGADASKMEKAIQKAGYMGYHNPEHPGVIKTFEDVSIDPTPQQMQRMAKKIAPDSVAGRAVRTATNPLIDRVESQGLLRDTPKPVSTNQLIDEARAKGFITDSAAVRAVRFAAAIRTPDGKVYTGFSHWPAIESAIAAGSLPEATAEGFEQALQKSKEGFVREGDNKFLTRNQASRAAELRGVPRRATGVRGLIGSEDLGAAGRKFDPNAVADSVAMQAVKGLPMLNTGKHSPLEWNEFTAEKSPFAVAGDRQFVFTLPNGNKVEIVGQRKGDDFRVSWAGAMNRGVKKDGESKFYVSGAGEAGPGTMRQVARQLRDITGAKSISGERISGARPFGEDIGGREAQRAITDSAYTRVLDAAFNEKPTGATAQRRKNLAEARKSAAIISGNPAKTWEAELGGKPLFDYRSLGKDIEPVVQQNVERNLPMNAKGFESYSRAAEQASDAMRSPENMARLDLGLRAGGEKWYFLDPIERAFKDEYGEEQGRKHFVDFTKTLGAGSPASDWGKNLERSLWAWPQVRARINMLEQPLPPGMGSLTQKVFQRGFQNVVEDKPITKNPYKVLSFAENLAGNFAPFTADRHMLRHYGLPEAGSGVGYAGVEDAAQEFAQEQAARIGMPPGRAPTAAVQSAPWIGDAIGGRVQSQPFPALLDIEQAIRRMAQQSGLTPNEALKRFIIQGDPFRR